ncbi:MAG: hypothetical protein LUD72_03820, partial [Bacteroidales bacterium]|nr:hypothetical protein [Bacteroidales bacterium]
MKIFTMSAMTLWGNTCNVTITTEKGSGSAVLQAASEMFEIETDDSTDVDTLLRATTGVLRFIVTDASQLNDILPDTVFGTRVEVSVTGSSGSERWKFVGYVERTEYSQDWDGEPFEMELPVRDAVSLFDSVSIEVNDDEYFAKCCTVARYIYEALTAAGFYKSDNTGFTPGNVYVEADDGDFLEQRVQREWFLDEESVFSDNDNSISMIGLNFDEILERLLRANGMEMWIEGDDVHFRRADIPEGWYYVYTWDRFVAIANETAFYRTSIELKTSGALEDNIRNISTGNSMGYLPGARRVIVNQSLDEFDLFELDSDWLSEWSLNYISYDTSYDAVLWLWRGATTQRNVTIRRQYYDVSSETLKDLPDNTLIGVTYNDNPIIGGVVCGIESCAPDELPSKSSLPVASSPSIVFLFTYINFYERSDGKTDEELLDNTWAFINAVSPVNIDGNAGGCICLTARLKTIRTQNEELSSVRYVPTRVPESQ